MNDEKKLFDEIVLKLSTHGAADDLVEKTAVRVIEARRAYFDRGQALTRVAELEKRIADQDNLIQTLEDDATKWRKAADEHELAAELERLRIRDRAHVEMIEDLKKRLADSDAAHKRCIEDMANTRGALNVIAQIVKPGMSYERPDEVAVAVRDRMADATKAPVVDGKTPGQIGFEAWQKRYVAERGGQPRTWADEVQLGHECEEASAQAVLRAFGGEALRKVREVAEDTGSWIMGAAHRQAIVRAIDSELANLGAPSCKVCHDTGRIPDVFLTNESHACPECGGAASITDPKKPTKPAEITDTKRPTKPRGEQ